MTVWSDSLEPLVFGSASANRVPPGSEAGPLPYLFFSSIMDADAARDFSQRVEYLHGLGREEYMVGKRRPGSGASRDSRGRAYHPAGRRSDAEESRPY